MTGQKHNLIVVYASKSERTGRFAIGGPDNLPVRYFQAGELGHPGATYNCEHSCVSVDEELFRVKEQLADYECYSSFASRSSQSPRLQGVNRRQISPYAVYIHSKPKHIAVRQHYSDEICLDRLGPADLLFH